ncbi:hypothetical protein HFP66_30380 [Bacillus sp. A17A.1]
MSNVLAKLFGVKKVEGDKPQYSESGCDSYELCKGKDGYYYKQGYITLNGKIVKTGCC